MEGNILIIGPREAEEPGFLKREFMEHIDKLPAWEKTKYYCLSHSLHKCRTGARLSLPQKMADHVGTTQSAVKVCVSGSVEREEIKNKQPDATNEFGQF